MGGGGGGATGTAGAAFDADGCDAALDFELGFAADEEESAGAVAGEELLDGSAGVDDLLHPPIVSTTATASNRAMKGVVRIRRLL
jgi:hypothetical protein